MPIFTSDPHHSERAKLAADAAVANDPRARSLILDPGVSIVDARGLVECAHHLAAGYRRSGTFDARNESQSLDLKTGVARAVSGDVTHLPGATVLGGYHVVAR